MCVTRKCSIFPYLWLFNDVLLIQDSNTRVSNRNMGPTKRHSKLFYFYYNMLPYKIISDMKEFGLDRCLYKSTCI